MAGQQPEAQRHRDDGQDQPHELQQHQHAPVGARLFAQRHALDQPARHRAEKRRRRIKSALAIDHKPYQMRRRNIEAQRQQAGPPARHFAPEPSGVNAPPMATPITGTKKKRSFCGTAICLPQGARAKGCRDANDE